MWAFVLLLRAREAIWRRRDVTLVARIKAGWRETGRAE